MATDSSEATLAAYAEAQARFETAGGYRWRDEARETVRGLGFEMDELDRDLATFSGGELTRASLARALAAQAGPPPSRRADQPSRHRLARVARANARPRWTPPSILVAHDRWFLESVGNSVLELGEGRPKFFAGPWHEWRIEKARRELFLERDAKRREADIARLERFVERFRAKNTLATRAKSKQKQINRIKRDAPERDGAGARSRSPSRSARRSASGKVVLAMEGATIDAGPEAALRGCRALGRGGRARLPDRPQRLGQVHADLDARGRARAGRRAGSRSATTSSSGTCASTPRCRPSPG